MKIFGWRNDEVRKKVLAKVFEEILFVKNRQLSLFTIDDLEGNADDDEDDAVESIYAKNRKACEDKITFRVRSIGVDLIEDVNITGEIGETHVDKLNDLIEIIESFNFHTQDDIDQVVNLKLNGTDEDRPKIDAILDAVVERFKDELQMEDDQIRCKSAIKNFNRCYPYFSAIMPFESPEWEKQYIFYSLLVKKLPKLKIDDYTDGLIDNIDFDKYRIVKEEERQIVLENENAEVKPVPVGQGSGKPQPEMEALSNIVKDFNDLFGNIDWKNRDEVQRQINELPNRIAGSADFVNAVKNGDSQVAQITFNDDMVAIVAAMLEEKTEFVQTYFNNPDFQNMVNTRVYQAAVSQLR